MKDEEERDKGQGGKGQGGENASVALHRSDAQRPLPIYRQIPLAFLLAPIILRILPMGNAFWLDEIWSWQISRVVTSPLQILTNPLAQSDNNHPLNTLWMYLVGDTSNWWIYRIPVLLAGCATVLLILWNERKISRWSAFTVSLLIGLSFVLITYSTEARGYAPMLLCAVGAYYFLRSARQHKGIIFGLICAIGLLCHLTFVHFLLAALAWVILQRRPRRLWIFGFPLAALAAYAWIFVRHIKIAGAPDALPLQTIASTLSVMLGGPYWGSAIYLCSPIALLCVVLALVWLYRRDSAEAGFFLTAIFLAPAATILFQHISPDSSPSLQIRYLLVPMVFSLILLSRYLAAKISEGSLQRRMAILLLGLGTLGNGYHLGCFLNVGRGDYRGAVEHMAALNSSPDITWCSSDMGNTFRDSSMLMYYRRFLPAGDTLQIANDPAWLIFNLVDPDQGTPPIQFNGKIYRFDSEYPAYGLSAWTWAIYRRQ